MVRGRIVVGGSGRRVGSRRQPGGWHPGRCLWRRGLARGETPDCGDADHDTSADRPVADDHQLDRAGHDDVLDDERAQATAASGAG